MTLNKDFDLDIYIHIFALRTILYKKLYLYYFEMNAKHQSILFNYNNSPTNNY